MCNVGCTEYRPSHLPSVGGGVLIPPMTAAVLAINDSSPTTAWFQGANVSAKGFLLEYLWSLYLGC